jgi:L,D-transpeptidase catalytic domain
MSPVKRRLVPSLALAIALLSGTSAAAAGNGTPRGPGRKPQKPAQATVRIQVGHLQGGRAQIFGAVPVVGSVDPFAPGLRVEVTFYLNGHRLLRRQVKVRRGNGGRGRFEASIIVRRDARYAASARLSSTASLRGDATIRKRWRVSFPALRHGQCGRVARGFKRALAKLGFDSGGGPCFNGRTGREVLAYRKVNAEARNQRAGRGLVKSVFDGRGGYRVRYPGAGEHAEVSLSKQVLVLARGSRPFAIYPVSTGKPSTPTITGHYRFYLRSPGYNSEGMYYSVYWHNGYAVHGYAEVPNYPASHGCVRTFIADQPRIYYQLNIGESIFVF